MPVEVAPVAGEMAVGGAKHLYKSPGWDQETASHHLPSPSGTHPQLEPPKKLPWTRMKAFLPFLFFILLPLASQNPVHSPQALLQLLGEDLAALLSHNEREPPLIPQGAFFQLLSRQRPPREPSSPLSEQAWLHLFKDFVNIPKKFRGHTKKMAQQGCFGIKLDRIGTFSGLGC